MFSLRGLRKYIPPKRDVLKAGLPICHIDRMIQETGEPFGDGSHIIYVNAQHKNDTPLGKLMHDFSCTQANDMHYPVLAERVRYFKENVKGAATSAIPEGIG